MGALIIAGLVLGAGACGSDDDDDTSSDTTEEATEETVSPDATDGEEGTGDSEVPTVTDVQEGLEEEAPDEAALIDWTASTWTDGLGFRLVLTEDQVSADDAGAVCEAAKSVVHAEDPAQKITVADGAGNNVAEISGDGADCVAPGSPG